MSKNPRGIAVPGGAAQPSERLNNMNTIEKVKKDFHEARIAGEQELSRGEITWEQYASRMIDFELRLKEMGVQL